MLSNYLMMSLAAFSETVRQREAWYGRGPKTGGPDPSTNPGDGPPAAPPEEPFEGRPGAL